MDNAVIGSQHSATPDSYSSPVSIDEVDVSTTSSYKLASTISLQHSTLSTVINEIVTRDESFKSSSETETDFLTTSLDSLSFTEFSTPLVTVDSVTSKSSLETDFTTYEYDSSIATTTMAETTVELRNNCGNYVGLKCNEFARYRSYDGSCNNLQSPSKGMANTNYVRLRPAVYFDRKFQIIESTSSLCKITNDILE